MTTIAAVSHRVAAALLAAAVTAVPAGCAIRPQVPETPPAAPGPVPWTPLVLRFGDRVATATLHDTPESRQLVAMLPADVDMKDVWAQAKSGRLPGELTVTSNAVVHDPVAGDVYLWPRSGVVAVYYDDLGQTVPDPGLVRLGVISAGLDSLAAAGERFTVRIEPAPADGA
ncbi:cyclophilin-like fold protein [Actinoplanes sp. G11-F43]|uniref:cyclophilin-like fold protein n=1 Tax=Actinoplanes sp. G11-F43 TaxID=3424130 RepID=UPI003D3507FD